MKKKGGGIVPSMNLKTGMEDLYYAEVQREFCEHGTVDPMYTQRHTHMWDSLGMLLNVEVNRSVFIIDSLTCNSCMMDHVSNALFI